MEFKEYTDGKRTIRATVKMYELLYKIQGFKLVEKKSHMPKNESKTESTTDRAD